MAIKSKLIMPGTIGISTTIVFYPKDYAALNKIILHHFYTISFYAHYTTNRPERAVYITKQTTCKNTGFVTNAVTNSLSCPQEAVRAPETNEITSFEQGFN